MNRKGKEISLDLHNLIKTQDNLCFGLVKVCAKPINSQIRYKQGDTILYNARNVRSKVLSLKNVRQVIRKTNTDS